jgi:hypothetical protein
MILALSHMLMFSKVLLVTLTSFIVNDFKLKYLDGVRKWINNTVQSTTPVTRC